MELSLTGTAANTPGVCPHGSNLLEFSDNVAHANGRYGLRIFDSWTPRENECSGDFAVARMERLLSWRNELNGVTATAIASVQFHDFVVVDNLKAGFLFRQIAFEEWGGALISNSMGVAYSDPSEIPASLAGRGVWLPMTHGLTIVNTTWVNYDRPGHGVFEGCAVCGTGGSPMLKQGGADTHIEEVRFVDSPHRTKFRWKYEMILTNTDGTLSAGSSAEASLSPPPQRMNTYVVPASKLLPGDRCTELPELSSAGLPGVVCTDTTIRRVGMNNARPTSISKKDLRVWVSGAEEETSEVVPWLFKPNPTHSNGFMFHLPTDGRAFGFQWVMQSFEYVDFESYTVGMSEMGPDEHVWISTPLLQWQDVDMLDRPMYNAQVDGGSRTGTNLTFTNDTLRGLQLPLPELPHSTWHTQMDGSDGVGGNFSYIIKGCEGQARCNRDWDVDIYPCPPHADPSQGIRCWPPPPPPPPPPPEDRRRRWSNGTSWTEMQMAPGNPHGPEAWLGGEGSMPPEGAHVWIPSWAHVLLDVSQTARLGHLIIEGILSFNGTDQTLVANIVHIRGGTLNIGSQAAPYPGRATIRLEGDRFSPEVHLGETAVELGTKSIGVFGTLEAWGKPHNVTWTRLSATASAGSAQLELEDAVEGDWMVGDEVVVAPTNVDPYEDEVRTIVSVQHNAATGGSTVQLDAPLVFTHFSGVEQ